MITICIASYGTENWRDLAFSRAYPSALGQNAEVVQIHQTHGTLASARNAAAAAASGEWLVFLDADDELHYNYIESIEAVLNGPGLYLPRTAFAKNGVIREPHFLGADNLRDGNPMIIGTTIPRRLFNQIGGFTDHVALFEDWLLFAQLWKAGAPIVRVPDAIYIAHMHRGSRNRQPKPPERLYWHQWIGHTVFPEHYGPTTPQEDSQRRLLVDGQTSGQLRIVA